MGNGSPKRAILALKPRPTKVDQGSPAPAAVWPGWGQRHSSGLFRLDLASQQIAQRFGQCQLLGPLFKVWLVEGRALHGDNPGRIAQLAVRWGDVIPVQFVQDDILG